MTQTTYGELLEYLAVPLTIPTLGGRKRITVAAFENLIMAKNSKGSIYRITAADWNTVKRIRARHPGNPWQGGHYTGFHEPSGYSLGYAAAMLRHIEEVEIDAALEEFMNGFCHESPDQRAA